MVCLVTITWERKLLGAAASADFCNIYVCIYNKYLYIVIYVCVKFRILSRGFHGNSQYDHNYYPNH